MPIYELYEKCSKEYSKEEVQNNFWEMIELQEAQSQHVS